MREMKDSGVEWIGEMPKDKIVLRNKYNFTYEKGKLPISTNIEKNGFPYIGASDLESDDEYSTYTDDASIPESEYDDLLVLWDGARAGLCGTHKKGKISSTIVRIRGNETIYPPFLYWYYKGFEDFMFQSVNGTTIPHMNRKYMEMMGWIDWTLDEQHVMVEYLDEKCKKIDTIIAIQQKNIEKLKKYKLSLIIETVTKGLNPNVKMKDSEIIWIGKIPSHWNILKLKSHTSMLTPMRDKPQDLSGEIPWVRIEDYVGKYISESKEGFGVSIQTVKEMNLKIYPVGTILCTSSCDLGKCAIVSKEMVSNQRFIGIIPDDKTLPDYLYYLMLSNNERLNHLATGTIQANLSRVAFEHLMVQFPPYEEQKDIATFLDNKCSAIDNAIETKQKMIDKLISYKKSLIYEMVTGKKDFNLI